MYVFIYMTILGILLCPYFGEKTCSQFAEMWSFWHRSFFANLYLAGLSATSLMSSAGIVVRFM